MSDKLRAESARLGNLPQHAAESGPWYFTTRRDGEGGTIFELWNRWRKIGERTAGYDVIPKAQAELFAAICRIHDMAAHIRALEAEREALEKRVRCLFDHLDMSIRPVQLSGRVKLPLKVDESGCSWTTYDEFLTAVDAVIAEAELRKREEEQ